MEYSLSADLSPCPPRERPDGSCSALVGRELENHTVFYSAWSKGISVVETKHMKTQLFVRIPVEGLNDTCDQFENLRDYHRDSAHFVT